MTPRRDTILARSRFGCAFTCAHCNIIHVEFCTMAFNFSLSEFSSFAKLLHRVDLSACERAERQAPWTRQIQIQLKPTWHMLALHTEELLDLRSLVAATSQSLFQSAGENIDLSEVVSDRLN